jgi:hypothetical protein
MTVAQIIEVVVVNFFFSKKGTCELLQERCCGIRVLSGLANHIFVLGMAAICWVVVHPI